MNTIIVATGNKDKMIEIRQILQGTGLEAVSMKEAGIRAEIIEDGTTFAENALIKARTVAKVSGKMALADDSGLVIDALDGAPGIYSARYMGEDTSYTIKNQSFLDKLQGLAGEQRSARYVCAMAAVYPDGRELVCEETMEGQIAMESAGENGFGYDPIFYLPEYDRTAAQLSPEEKNAVSHRGKALRRMRTMLMEAER